ncbi:alpha-arrestin [Aspergillus lucknowensis]|uniref:LDB19 N-terminal domain-containing protein n=1 Tax=Aspergillus lucknowensis TaxID=176173 RepID=A0ABR4L834_9EURO
MPGRLLPSFVRPSSSHHSIFAHSNSSSTRSSTSSVNEVANTAMPSKNPSAHSQERPQSPERRLSFSMDHFIHTYRDHNKEKRRTGRSSRSKERTGHGDAVAASAKLDVIIESPPLVCYGTPANSTGCLFSGRLRVSVPESTGAVTLDKFDMHLMMKRTTKKPVSRDCPSCASRTEELTNWNFLSERLVLTPGDHDFPFSYLFPGNLPASCSSSLGQVEYILQAHAHNANGEDYNFKYPLHLKRAILPSNDKSSIRIFPPTNLTGRIVLPSVVHPIGTFPVQMTLSGILDKDEATQTRWRLRKMMWRIEEHQKIVSTACPKHAHKIGGEGKGVLHQETRIIGHNEEKDGWKTDFDTAGGEISMEFDASINPNANPLCDVEASNGLEAKHNLVIELIVAEEVCPNRNTRLITPTGAARVLRMQFNLHVTERSGLGISWDEEMPPVYEDVPASPPCYTMLDGRSVMEDYQGPPLPYPEHEELERMESLRLDHSSTNSSARGRVRLTTDDLNAEPLELEPRNRAPSEDSRLS